VLLVQGTPWADALRACVHREDVGLVIDDGTSHAITLGRGDMQRLLGLFEPPLPSRSRTLLDRAREGVTPALVTAPHRTDEDARAFLETLEAKLGQGLPTWLFVETLMYEMRVHLQIDPRPSEGLRWPSSHRGPGERGRGTVFAFTGAGTLREAIARRPDSGTSGIELAAVEALRWILAAPDSIEILTLVGHLHEKGQARPVDIYLPALLPTAHHVPDLRRVPVVPLDRLGAVPGGRALRPEAVRALALGWRHLVGFTDGPTIDLGGRAWKAVASSISAEGTEPPFLRWLGQLGGAAGLVLDPGGPAPLKIEPVDLLMLDRWAAHPERQPDAHEALLWAAGLLAAGAITPEMAGRMAAEFPFYWICTRAAGAEAEVLMYPNTDALLLFTSEGWARHFLGGGRLAEGFTPGRVRFDWARNPFAMALEDYSEAWIDPGSPTAGGGLRLSHDALKAAVARLDETLKPRVPGFIAE
jgi:hypothetical protein